MGLLSLSAGVMVTYAGYLSEKSTLVTSTGVGVKAEGKDRGHHHEAAQEC